MDFDMLVTSTEYSAASGSMTQSLSVSCLDFFFFFSEFALAGICLENILDFQILRLRGQSLWDEELSNCRRENQPQHMAPSGVGGRQVG